MLVKVFISYVIPDIPKWLETEMAKIEYKRREIEKGTTTVLPFQTSVSTDTEDKEMQTEPR